MSESMDHGKILTQKIMNFSKSIDNLRDFVEVVGSVLDKKRDEDFMRDPHAIAAHLLAVQEAYPDSQWPTDQIDKMRKACDGKYEIEVSDAPDGDDKRIVIRAVGASGDALHSAAESIRREIKRRASLYNTSLISLLSEAEWFCAQLLHYYFQKHPDAAGLREKNFSYEELLKFSSIEEAKKYLVDNKVEDILRGSFSDWIDFFKEKIKISIHSFSDDLPFAQEASLRRNLLVHNGGIVNQTYLNRFPMEIDPRPVLGAQIQITREYLTDRTDRLEIVFSILALEIWGKIAKGDQDRGVVAAGMGFDALSKERYAVAEALCRYGMNDKSIASDSRANSLVNYWQSFKWSNRFEKIRSEVEDWDVRTMDLPYQAAKCALLDQNENCDAILRRALKAERITVEDLRVWPLFRNLREMGVLSDLLNPVAEDQVDASSEVGTDRAATVAAPSKRARRTVPSKKPLDS